MLYVLLTGITFVNFMITALKKQIWVPKCPKTCNFSPRDIHTSGVLFMFRGMWGLKMVPEVIIRIDGYKKAVLKLILESRYLSTTLVPPQL